MKTWLDKMSNFWCRQWLKLIIISYFIFMPILLSLKHIYKIGMLSVNIAEYLAIATTFTILLFMTVDYVRQICSIIKREKK